MTRVSFYSVFYNTENNTVTPRVPVKIANVSLSNAVPLPLETKIDWFDLKKYKGCTLHLSDRASGRIEIVGVDEPARKSRGSLRTSLINMILDYSQATDALSREIKQQTNLEMAFAKSDLFIVLQHEKEFRATLLADFMNDNYDEITAHLNT